MRYLRAIALLLMVLAAAPAQAGQQPPPKPVPQDEFVPVDAPLNAKDAMPAPLLVSIAYGFIWVVLFGYLWSLRGRLAKVEREFEAVSARLGKRGPG